jgi:hypothetical protein
MKVKFALNFPSAFFEFKHANADLPFQVELGTGKSSTCQLLVHLAAVK